MSSVSTRADGHVVWQAEQRIVIAAHHLGFRYPDSGDVLCDLNLSIHRG